MFITNILFKNDEIFELNKIFNIFFWFLQDFTEKNTKTIKSENLSMLD